MFVRPFVVTSDEYLYSIVYSLRVRAMEPANGVRFLPVPITMENPYCKFRQWKYSSFRISSCSKKCVNTGFALLITSKESNEKVTGFHHQRI